jgi:hypothetical protein
METKPYSLQAPEQIAKDYGGNKQKIAEAMQIGVLDPTAGTLAGMFIDRIRAAAQQEQAPTQTVAEQVFTPPAPPAPMGGMPPQGGMPPPPPMGAPSAPMGPPAGLGATPEAAQMPQMGMPPQGMPAPQGEMPMMAMGGMVPPYMSGGGLSDLPVPDGMFDEPSNGGFNDGYAGGGLVAFLEGGLVKEKTPEEIAAEEAEKAYLAALDSEYVPPQALGAPIVVSAQNEPDQIRGFYRDATANKTNVIDKLAPRQTKYGDELNKFYENVRSPEAQKARAKDDFFLALGALGAKMASTPGTLFQSFSAGAADAIPQLAASAKERRVEQRDAVKALAMQEGLSNKEALQVANMALGMSGKYGEFRESDLSREQQRVLEMLKETGLNLRNKETIASGERRSKMAADATMGSAKEATKRDIVAARREGGRLFDEGMARTPEMANMKQADPVKFMKLRSQYVDEYVFGPAINLD